jgi:hypothetical protein
VANADATGDTNPESREANATDERYAAAGAGKNNTAAKGNADRQSTESDTDTRSDSAQINATANAGPDSG